MGLFRLRYFFSFLRDVARQSSQHRVTRMSAALSYYAMFSLAPFLLLAVTIIRILFNRETARSQIVIQLQNLCGPQLGQAIESILEISSHQRAGSLTTFLGIFAISLGAMSALNELQDSLNTIWNTPKERISGWRAYLVKQFISLVSGLGIGAVLLLIIISNLVLSMASHWLSSEHLLSRRSDLWLWANGLISFVLLASVFAAIYKYVPRVKISFRHIWLGSIFSAAFFIFGKFFLGFYLSHAAIRSTYGAAGSLVVILIWVYYAAQVFLMGAEINRAVANRLGTSS